jgi:hypothetical protein
MKSFQLFIKILLFINLFVVFFVITKLTFPTDSSKMLVFFTKVTPSLIPLVILLIIVFLIKKYRNQ